MADGQYRADIDGLRGIAVAAVVMFHAFPAALPGGFVGVDVFFVISGFLISSLVLHAVAGGTFRFSTFYARRIRRLFPALVLVLAASLAAGWYLLTPRAFAQLGADTATSAAFLANLAFWRQAGYFGPAAETTPLLHLWSLGVEEQFYLTWPVLLAAAARWRLNLSALTLVLVAVSFAANLVVVRGDTASAFYLPHTRAWELLAGAALAIRGHQAAYGAGRASAVGVTLIAVACVVINGDTPFPGWWAVLPVLGASLVIGSGPAAPVNRFLSHRALVWLGLISYPLYLWHWPLLSFARLALVEQPQTPIVIGLIAIAVVLAWLTQSLVERPIRFGALCRSTPAIATLVVGVMAVGAAGVAAAEGWVRRPAVGHPDVERVLANDYDYRRGYRGGVCQLSNEQTPEQYGSECVDAGFGEPGRQSVLIWGDSHAAHLYPGLRARAAAAGLALAQFTADGCSPVIDDCRINAFVLGRLPALKPDVIVLASTWDDVRIRRVPEAIARIRQATDAAIVVVGPVPGWPAPLPQVLFRFIQDHPDAPLPERLTGANERTLQEQDRALRAATQGTRTGYVSALDALCNRDGCLIVIDGRTTAFDTAHLTDVGSAVVADAVLARVKDLQ